MRKRPQLIGLVVLAVLLASPFVVLFWLGFGPVVVVLRNVGTERTEVVTVLQVSEGGSNEVRVERNPVRLGPGATAELELDTKNDVVLQIRLASATGEARQFTVPQYLSSGARLTIQVEIANGNLTRVRVRSRWDAYEDMEWRSP